MKRGDLFRIRRPRKDPKPARVFVVVSRQVVVDSRYSTVVCAPVLSRRDGLSTQVDVGPEHGLKHDSSIHCDTLVSIEKSRLTDYLSSLPLDRISALNKALRVALGLD